MSNTLPLEKERKSFAKVKIVQEMPNLLEVQLKSFDEFLQKDTMPLERKNIGLESAFRNVFPVEDTHGNYLLEYKYYTIGEPRYTCLLYTSDAADDPLCVPLGGRRIIT